MDTFTWYAFTTFCTWNFNFYYNFYLNTVQAVKGSQDTFQVKRKQMSAKNLTSINYHNMRCFEPRIQKKK